MILANSNTTSQSFLEHDIHDQLQVHQNCGAHFVFHFLCVNVLNYLQEAQLFMVTME